MAADWTRGTIPAGVRREITSLPCAYCGSEDEAVIDHIMPFSRGGTDDRSNLAPACWPCNKEKTDTTPDEWRDWRLARGLSWPVDRVSDHMQTIRSHVERAAAERGLTVEEFAKELGY